MAIGPEDNARTLTDRARRFYENRISLKRQQIRDIVIELAGLEFQAEIDALRLQELLQPDRTTVLGKRSAADI